MRTCPALLLVALALASALGCAGVQPLAGTISYARLPEGAAPRPEDLEAALGSGEQDGETVLASVAVGPSSWVLWARSGPGTRLFHVERTALGLEVRDARWMTSRALRPTLSAWSIGRRVVVAAESSDEIASTARRARLFVDEHTTLTELRLDDAPAELVMRAERLGAAHGGWQRAATCTTTLARVDDALVAHEHASVREIDPRRPELSARSTYEVVRARRFRIEGATLVPDRPSIFDEL